MRLPCLALANPAPDSPTAKLACRSCVIIVAGTVRGWRQPSQGHGRRGSNPDAQTPPAPSAVLVRPDLSVERGARCM